MKLEFVGKINFGQHVDITDPRYDSTYWRLIVDAAPGINDFQIEPGEYSCFVSYKDEGLYGTRVEAIAIAKKKKHLIGAGKLELAGFIGVDSRMAGFFERKPDFTIEESYEFYDLTAGKQKVFYSPDGEYLCKGFFSTSGDGEYPFYKHMNEEGVPNALLLKFCRKPLHYPVRKT